VSTASRRAKKTQCEEDEEELKKMCDSHQVEEDPVEEDPIFKPADS